MYQWAICISRISGIFLPIFFLFCLNKETFETVKNKNKIKFNFFVFVLKFLLVTINLTTYGDKKKKDEEKKSRKKRKVILNREENVCI